MPTVTAKRRTGSTDRKRAGRRPPRTIQARRFRHRVLTSLYVAILIESIAALLSSPVFAVKHIIVRGTGGLSAPEIETVKTAIAIRPNTNILLARTAQVKSRLAGMAWTEGVAVGRHVPDTIQITVTQRIPAVVAESNGTSYEVDNSGFVIRIARTEADSHLPHILLEGQPALQIGTIAPRQGLRSAIQVYEKVGKDPVVAIGKIKVDQNDNMCLNMLSGFRIQLGRMDAIDTKIKLARKALVKEPDIAARLSEINLSVPEAPACTPRIDEASPQGHPVTSDPESPPQSKPSVPHEQSFPGLTIL